MLVKFCLQQHKKCAKSWHLNLVGRSFTRKSILVSRAHSTRTRKNAHSRVSHEVNWSLCHAIVNNSHNWFRQIGVYTLYAGLLECYILSVSFLLPFIHLNFKKQKWVYYHCYSISNEWAKNFRLCQQTITAWKIPNRRLRT